MKSSYFIYERSTGRILRRIYTDNAEIDLHLQFDEAWGIGSPDDRYQYFDGTQVTARPQMNISVKGLLIENIPKDTHFTIRSRTKGVIVRDVCSDGTLDLEDADGEYDILFENFPYRPEKVTINAS